MFRRLSVVLLLAASMMTVVACKNHKVNNPLAQVNSKQPDKVLYDRALDAMKQRKYDVARMTLQTLINTYPDSEYVARAKLTIGDAWYQEGGTAALAQAESEYKDFITFFPNMAEASEAQLKVADIHYRQMEKPDRDYTHARRAEEEYRQLLLQYPDSKLADTARQRLLQVQEVLAEREYRIGRFYYNRGSLIAAMARIKSLTDTYPLYSKADEALYLLGQAYEQQIAMTRKSGATDSLKAKLIKTYTDEAAAAYSKIVTRYPAMDRYQDARARLAALDRPVPNPTEEALAQNKKEEESRGTLGRVNRVMLNLHKRPDLSTAAKVGEPTLVDPKQSDATQLVRQVNDAVKADFEATHGGGEHKVAAETVAADGKIPENQAAPRSDAEPVNPSDVPRQAPAQVNEVADSAASSSATAGQTAQSAHEDKKNTSSSKKKKRKMILF